MYPLKPTISILEDSFTIYQGSCILSMKSMILMFTKWEITNIFKNDNIPFVFFWCDLFFMSEHCLIKRHGRPRNIENQPAISSPQSYVFTLLWEKRHLTTFDCPSINLQNWRQITKMFILLLSIQNIESVLSNECLTWILHNFIPPFPQLYSVTLEVNIHEI